MRAHLADNLKSFICYKHLIERNRKCEAINEITKDTKKVNLPFILMATKDCKDNEIDLFYG
jgi:hypothetical protein